MAKWGREQIETPCVNICEIDPVEKICIGCYRSITEIGLWSRMSAEERREIMAELPGRAGRVSRRGRRK